MSKRAVVAIGGNAITRAGQVGTIPEQFANSEQACRNLLVLLEQGYDLALSNGNGPQVGNILLRVELSSHQVYTVPLDTCVSGVDRVYLNFGKPNQRPLEQISADEAERHLEEGQFPAESMGPKIRAAIDYLRHGGREVLITDISAIHRALAGETGTRIVG